jgi:hypothetical protein
MILFMKYFWPRIYADHADQKSVSPIRIVGAKIRAISVIAQQPFR